MIRPLELRDSAGLTELFRNALDYDITEETVSGRMDKLLQRPGYLFLADEEDGILAGFIQAADYASLSLGHMKNIMGLAVAQEYRGRGIGRRLVEAAERWAAEDGCAGVRLNSGMERTGAHEFYRRCGYDIRKEQKQLIKLFTDSYLP